MILRFVRVPTLVALVVAAMNTYACDAIAACEKPCSSSVDCDDGNACTSDYCAAGGCPSGTDCYHLSITCPNPANTCDPMTGCPGVVSTTTTMTSTTTTTLQGPLVGTLDVHQGRAFVIRADGTIILVEAGDSGLELFAGDTVRTDVNSEAVVRQPGLGTTHLLRAESSMLLRAPVEGEASGLRKISVLRGFISFWLPPSDQKTHRFQASTGTVSCLVKGTAFSLGYDPATQVSTVSVTEHTVDVTPTNSAFQPFTLNAGQQVQVGSDSMSPVTALPLTCAPTSGTSKKARRAAAVKVRCASTASAVQTVAVTGVTPGTCTLVKPVSRSVPAHKRRSFKARVRCQSAGQFFVLTGDGLPG